VNIAANLQTHTSYVSAAKISFGSKCYPSCLGPGMSEVGSRAAEFGVCLEKAGSGRWKLERTDLGRAVP
jgi:hypothetical protein